MARCGKGQEKRCGGAVGIDLGKRHLEVCRLSADGNDVERLRTETNEGGMRELAKWLRPDDVIALEAGNQSFRVARMLAARGHETHVLNPGDLATIYNSLKKTDREDALKLARLILRIPARELPTVPVPSEETEADRRLLGEQEHWTGQATRAKNRLHNLFAQAGVTVVRKELADGQYRAERVGELPNAFVDEAVRHHEHLLFIEGMLATVKTKIAARLKQDVAYATLVMSMPGIGPVTALALRAYLGDCLRFSSGGQVANYVGLVPRIDISGDTVRRGSITKRGAHLLRRTLVPGAWALVRSAHGGPPRAFYEAKKGTIGKKKAIVATARKMIEILYAMIRSGSRFAFMPPDELAKKMRMYALI